MSPRSAAAVLIVLALVWLGGCTDDGYQLEIEVRAGAAAATDFGVAPGDSLPEAEIDVRGPGDSDEVFDAVSSDAGEATIDLPGEGSYEVFITAPTTDPLCTWLGGATVAVEERTTALVVDDLMVACQ